VCVTGCVRMTVVQDWWGWGLTWWLTWLFWQACGDDGPSSKLHLMSSSAEVAVVAGAGPR
jgi:hypothetical protein